jgi:hypothetical protein
MPYRPLPCRNLPEQKTGSGTRPLPDLLLRAPPNVEPGIIALRRETFSVAASRNRLARLSRNRPRQKPHERALIQPGCCDSMTSASRSNASVFPCGGCRRRCRFDKLNDDALWRVRLVSDRRSPDILAPELDDEMPSGCVIHRKMQFVSRRSSLHAARIFVALMRDSTGMPSFSCRRGTIARFSGRLRASSS